MIVICIDGKPNVAQRPLPEGVPLSVRQDETDEDYYIVSGYEIDYDGVPIAWGKRRFIPISEIDETEFSRTYQKETV